MTIKISGTQPINIKTFDKSKLPQRPMMDHMHILDSEANVRIAEDLLKGVKDIGNLLSTEAGRTVLKMADMEVDGKKCITAEKWNAYIAENFPHAGAKPVANYIPLVDAMNSLTTYIVKEQTAQKTEEKAALEAKSKEEGGDGKAPDMGV